MVTFKLTVFKMFKNSLRFALLGIKRNFVALIGIILYMFCKGSKKKDVGTILLGFATLMFGMETMSGAVKGLAEVEWFTNLFSFENFY